MPKTPAIQASLQYLHPKAQEAFRALGDDLAKAHEAGATKTLFIPFETYRSPMRQEELFKQKPPVTKARPWYSAHNYGLAVDYVAFDDEPWGDHHDWQFLEDRAKAHGLTRPIRWDLGHIEHPLFKLFMAN